MQIILNGKEHQLNRPATINDLLIDLGQDDSRVVAEVNSLIMQRDQYQDVFLNEGDIVEIVKLVGGG
ncbi:MAG: sulfur carrier protein ThiS [Candidatus Edwardsbacteria bacterium]|nr:sulfur carrier protein ThiS [Candidatus Edwardsbacteria bacterium]MBU1577365.1 sulfur carrier protein ThiS [Candidatus Edwardsbacteria bacterium]MBU2463195.1 sulfur carrier protein ThiS [Candidatus Edwardsbacteria bacterium]MBU2594166.1 sulfur carrier protein ThiS [Candidatus Edwardsbacteria bacterium]